MLLYHLSKRWHQANTIMKKWRNITASCWLANFLEQNSCKKLETVPLENRSKNLCSVHPWMRRLTFISLQVCLFGTINFLVKNCDIPIWISESSFWFVYMMHFTNFNLKNDFHSNKSNEVHSLEWSKTFVLSKPLSH